MKVEIQTVQRNIIMAYLLLGIALGFLLGLVTGVFMGKRGNAALLAGTPRLEGPESPADNDSLPPGISLVVNGRTLDVPAEAMAEIQDLIRAKQIIDAIKALREATGMGLAEAKAVMESLEQVIH